MNPKFWGNCSHLICTIWISNPCCFFVNNTRGAVFSGRAFHLGWILSSSSRRTSLHIGVRVMGVSSKADKVGRCPFPTGVRDHRRGTHLRQYDFVRKLYLIQRRLLIILGSFKCLDLVLLLWLAPTVLSWWWWSLIWGLFHFRQVDWIVLQWNVSSLQVVHVWRWKCKIGTICISWIGCGLNLLEAFGYVLIWVMIVIQMAIVWTCQLFLNQATVVWTLVSRTPNSWRTMRTSWTRSQCAFCLATQCLWIYHVALRDQRFLFLTRLAR